MADVEALVKTKISLPLQEKKVWFPDHPAESVTTTNRLVQSFYLMHATEC